MNVVVAGERLSKAANAPGGLSDAEFKSWYAEAGDWLFGVVQGGFNEKMSVSQIIVDAIIGMIPLVGDVTAVRDLIAISMLMTDSEEERKNKWNWIEVVILLLALIPVLGGVIKGVGKLTTRAAKAAVKANPDAVLRILAITAEEVIEFMNRLGVGNAKKWFLDLDITKHKADVLQHFNSYTNGIVTAIDTTLKRMKWVLPNNLIARMQQISASVKKLKAAGAEMIPDALKEFNDMLKWMQEYIRTGGSPELALSAVGSGAARGATNTSNAMASTSHGASGATPPPKDAEKVKVAAAKGDGKPPKLANVQDSAVAGKQNKSQTKEARLKKQQNGQRPKPGTVGRPQNTAIKGKDDWEKYYEPEPGYPDLTKYVDDSGHYPDIEAYSGRMVNRALEPNEKIYRVFGDPGNTHGFDVGEAKAGGKWWGIGEPPLDAKAWREKCAVKDEWNRDGFIVEGLPPNPPLADKKIPKGVFGDISEQYSKDIPGQHLPGGNPQAILDIPKSTTDMLTEMGRATIGDGLPRKFTCPHTGIVFEVKPTNWPDANGVHGYYATPGAANTTVGAHPVHTAANSITPQTNPETHIK